jgi:hypothetical protein
MFFCNRTARPTLRFPNEGTNTRIHSLWLSNLFVDLTRVGPNPILRSHTSYLTVANVNHQAMIADILLIWYMFLGGHVEEETVWAVDKSYAAISSFIPACLTSRTPVIHWETSFPTYLQEWWTSLSVEIVFDISSTSSSFWQHGRNALNI